MTDSVSPLDRLMQEHGLVNHDLVEAYQQLCGAQVTHKTIQKARTAKRTLSRKLQLQVVDALNAKLQPEKPWRREDLFPA